MSTQLFGGNCQNPQSSSHACPQARHSQGTQEGKEAFFRDDDRGASACGSAGTGGRGGNQEWALKAGFLQALSGDRDDLLG